MICTHPPCGYKYGVLGGMKDVPPVDIVWGLGYEGYAPPCGYSMGCWGYEICAPCGYSMGSWGMKEVPPPCVYSMGCWGMKDLLYILFRHLLHTVPFFLILSVCVLYSFL